MVAAAEKPVRQLMKTLPLRSRLMIKTMVISKGMTTSQIAKVPDIGLNFAQIRNLVWREGWARDRVKLDQIESAKHAREVDAAILHERECIAIESTELVMGGLDLAREAITNKDTRSYAQAAQGIRSLATVARECRKAESELAGSGASTSINLFFMSKPSPQIAGPKEVPAIEV